MDGGSLRSRPIALAAAAVLLAALVPARPAAGGDCTPTPSNAQGPFYLPDAPFVTELATPDEPGERIELAGRVYDYPNCEPVPGAILDVWQANAEGIYYNVEAAVAPAGYLLRGRVRTDEEGRFRVRTVRPGSYRTGPRSHRPSHIHVRVTAPAIETLTTQVYLPGDPNLGSDTLVVPALVGQIVTRAGAPAILSFDFVVPSARQRRGE